MSADKLDEEKKLPPGRITILDSRHEPPSMAAGLTVDRVHAILRNAEAGDTRDLFCLYRDVVLSQSHLQGEFAKRKLAVVGDPQSFLPAEAKSPKDVQAAELIQSMVRDCKFWRLACANILDGCLYPVSVTEKVFEPSSVPGLRFSLKDLVPVPHYLLDYMTGKLRIFDVDASTGQILSTTHVADPSRYIIHRGHLLSAPDNWGGPLRSILFWWLLSAMDREWWARFLDRYGSPFLVGTYDRGDSNSKSVLERAFSLAVKLGGLVVADGTNVEIKEAAAASTGEAYERFLTLCNREISKLILGQTLSAEAAPTGELGGGTARMQEEVRQDIRKFDAAMLADTLRDQLFSQFLAINGVRAAPPVISFGSDSADNIRATMTLVQSAYAAGLELDDDGLAAVNKLTGITLRRRAAMSPLPFTAREVGAVHPFSLQTLPALRRR